MARKPPIIGINDEKLAIITPSLFCNYDCTYCRIKSKTRATDEREMHEWLTALKNIGSPIVHIAGGEPTILPGFDEFVFSYPGLLRMTTNLSRDPSRMPREYYKKFDYLTLSFHPEFTTFEKFKDRAEYIYDLFKLEPENAPRMACTIVAFPKFLPKIEMWIEQLRNVGVNARGQYFNAPAGSNMKTYSEAELELLEGMNIPMSSEEAGQAEIEFPTLKSSNAGLYYTHISRRGDARRCSRDNMSLGNIFDGTFAWLTENALCTTPCTEACDKSFTKYSIISHIEPKNNNTNRGPTSQYTELLVNKLSTDQKIGWFGNEKSTIEINDDAITIKRNGGALENQFVQRVPTEPKSVYEFRTNVISTSHECIIRINGRNLWSGKRGRVKLVFTADSLNSVIEILPSASWYAEAKISIPSCAKSIPTGL